MKPKIFLDVDSDPVKVELDEYYVNLECTQSTNRDPTVAMACMDADTAESVGKRLIKAAKKLRKVEADGEA